ncbi:MAG: F0F1 ATP synthase subunit alpha, partial [Clostridia bacterium]|nr:F0F1 ATP synthase subunit alpha [Clostridia bacterium]
MADFQLISQQLKEQIAALPKSGTVHSAGRVKTVNDGVVLIEGLAGVVMGELLYLGGEKYALALNLEENQVGAILLSGEDDVSSGDIVYATKRVASVPVGRDLLGRVIDPLGNPLDGGRPIRPHGYRDLESPAPTIWQRAKVDESLETGVKAIDSIVPIGKGQRELIIGDRQTGKTSLAVDAIINQKGKDVVCVYVAIGQKISTVRKLIDDLVAHDAMSYTVVVSATAADSAPLQYLAPYTGTAIAEDFMYKGKDALIIYDDLSKHAVAYRTISLLLRRPSGREAYPGDIFYLHSRLLERSAHLSPAMGGGSLTALPIIETLSGDIAAYVPTNVISITDGQIYLESELFHAGIRPAINVGLSVSRVGSAAQSQAIKRLSGKIRLDLAHFREMQLFARFGADLDAGTKAILARGERLTESLKQPRYAPCTLEDMTVEL